MRIKEIMERVDNPTYDPGVGVLRNIGRAGLDQFVRGQVGVSAYSDEEEETRRGQRAQRQQQQTAQAARRRGEQDIAQVISQTEIPARMRTEPATQTVASPPPTSIVQTPPAQAAAAPAVDAAKPPEVYTLDGQPLNPSNPIHARLIAQMQQQGITQARTGTPKK